LGTKHMSAAFTKSYRLVPSIAFILSSRVANFSRPFYFTTLSFWDSFIVKSMTGGILMGYTSWVDRKHAVCSDSGNTLFAPRFGGLKGVTGINTNWAMTIGYTDVDSPDLYLKACSSRLVSLMTFSLRLFNFFWCWAELFILFSFIFFLSECYTCNLIGDLYVNLLNENHAIIQSKYKM
jgi:hypothetical protein